MNKLLAASVRRIVAAGGQLDAVADFDDLLNLHRLSEAALGVDRRDPRYIAALHPVLTYAGQTFERVSIGVRLFAEECGDPWTSGDPRMRDLAWCYLMAHARRPEIVWEHQSRGPEQFRRAVAAWCRSLAVTDDELLMTMDAWLTKGRSARTASETAPDEQQGDLSDVLEELASEYGEPDLFVWLWNKSESEVALLYDRMQERKARENGNHVSGGSDRFHLAMREYRAAEMALSEKVTKRGTGCQPRPQDDDPRSDRQPA